MSDEPSDDDKTPPRGKRPLSAWDDDQRAAVGRDHRSGNGHVPPSSIESERSRQRRLRREARAAIPDHVERELGGGEVQPVAVETTEPWEILDRDELRPDEEEIVKRSKRNSQDPIFVADWAKTMARVEKLIARLGRKEVDDISTEQRRANEYMAIIDTTPSGKLAARVTQLEGNAVAAAKRGSNWNWALRGIALLCAGGLLTFVDRIWDRSAHETEMTFRLRAAEETIKRLDAAVDRCERRLNAPAWAPQHSNKDPQP